MFLLKGIIFIVLLFVGYFVIYEGLLKYYHYKDISDHKDQDKDWWV
jgi:hypothetical protein